MIRSISDNSTPREDYEWSARQAKALAISAFIRRISVDIGIIILIAIFIRYAAWRYWYWI